MPKIPVMGLKGFTSQADALVDPKFASDCRNVVFHKGDLCNIPYPKFNLTTNPFNTNIISHILGALMLSLGTNQRFIVLHKSYRIFETGASSYTFLIQAANDVLFSVHLSALADYESIFDPQHSSKIINPGEVERVKSGPRSNFVQVGEWVLHLGFFQDYENILIDDVLYKKIPRMARFRQPAIGAITPRLIGIKSPRKAEFKNAVNGSVTVTNVRYGFSFVSIMKLNADNNDPVDTQEIQFGDIESNVTAAEADSTVTNKALNFLLHLPPKQDNFEPSFDDRIIVGIYIRPENLTDFRFVEYVYGHHRVLDENDVFFETGPIVEARVVTDGEGDATKVGAQTGAIPIVGARDVPRPAWHGIFFEGRMYYASIREDVFNVMQFSQLAADNDPDQGEYSQYIEGEIQVGSDGEAITGFLAYRNDLVIFKETETYVLSGDPQLSNIRYLFTKVGCVGIDGGHAYLAEGDVIYWVGEEGVYKFSGIHTFSGAVDPILISDPISEELRKIDRGRYSVCRLSIDPRYGHIYLTFPKGSLGNQDIEIPTYVYHIKEEGNVWTKIDPVDQILSYKSDKIYDNITAILSKKSLDVLKDIDENANENFTRSWFYNTVNIVAGNFDDTKHWKFFNVYSLKDLLLDFSVFSESGLLFTLKRIIKRIRLGIRSQFVNVKFGSDASGEAFRIKGYEIDVHVTRKR